MYLRTTSRRTKDGSTVRYLQLAHNERNEKGVPVAKVIHNLGREDMLDRKALVRLVRSIQRFLDPTEQLASDTPHGFKFLSAPEIGGPHLIGALWSELGIGKALGRAVRKSRYRSEVERCVFTMVAQRALAPASKLEATRWLAEDVVLDGISEISEDELYRAMDFLLECADRVQESVFFSVATLLNLEVDVIFFDTTSTYFETEPDVVDADDGDDSVDEKLSDEVRSTDSASMRRLGHSKDHRPDRPQVVIGMAVTREGIPVRVWSWPGNRSDQSVVKEVKDDLRGWRLGRVVTVVDSGFSSDENLRYLTRAGGHWIAGEKMRDGSKDARSALSSPGRFKKVRDNLRVKEVSIGAGDSAKRFIVCHNPSEAERDRQRRNQKIVRIKTELDRINAQRQKAKTKKELDAHTKAECALRNHPTLARYILQTKTGRLTLDRSKIAAEERLDGKYLLSTSDPDLSAEDVALGYKNLLEAERGFSDLKGTLALRPVFHRLDHRIQAHILICFLALVIVRIAEKRSDETWRTIRAELAQIRLGHFHSSEGQFTQTTELTDTQRCLLRTLGVSDPPRFGQITPKTTKNT